MEKLEFIDYLLGIYPRVDNELVLERLYDISKSDTTRNIPIFNEDYEIRREIYTNQGLGLIGKTTKELFSEEDFKFNNIKKEEIIFCNSLNLIDLATVADIIERVPVVNNYSVGRILHTIRHLCNNIEHSGVIKGSGLDEYNKQFYLLNLTAVNDIVYMYYPFLDEVEYVIYRGLFHVNQQSGANRLKNIVEDTLVYLNEEFFIIDLNDIKHRYEDIYNVDGYTKSAVERAMNLITVEGFPY